MENDFFSDLINRFNGFWSFLGDFGLFLSPDFGRKLGNDNQLQIYKNQALFEAMEDSQSRVMMKGSQAKAIFIQGSC
jgi:hypothetical protein